MLNRFMIILVVALLSPTFSSARFIQDKVPTTSEQIATPQHTYKLYYVLHAKRAELHRIDNRTFQLILFTPYEVINLVHKSYKQKPTIIPLQQFINYWQKHENLSARSDITGIQVNRYTIGHAQFYTTARISDPQYIEEQNKIIFTFIPLNKFNLAHSAYFETVTVFFDGCDICNCTLSLKNCI